MELKGIKNIIFDLGGVLLNLNFNLTQKAFIELGVDDFDAYYTKAKQNGLFDLYETGKLTELEFCDALKNLTGLTSTNQEIIDAWNAMLLNFPVVRKELLLALGKEHKIFLLSNTNETHVKAFNRIIKNDIGLGSLDSLFEKCYLSNEIGYRKPNAAIFNFVLSQNHLNPSETLFIDDSPQHIQGAENVSIRGCYLNLDKGESVEGLFANFLT